MVNPLELLRLRARGRGMHRQIRADSGVYGTFVLCLKQHLPRDACLLQRVNNQ